MDILLTYLPLCNHEHPHLGLPFLKSFLVESGHNSCLIKDYNVILIDRILKEKMAENKNNEFDTQNNVVYKYDTLRSIMKGTTPSDRLKSEWAAKILSNYLVVGGKHVQAIGFDPTSFHEIENKFIDTNISIDTNAVIQYINNEVIPDIVKIAPKIFAASVVFSSQILYTLLICKEIRKKLPDTKIILGGAQISLFWHAFINSAVFRSYFDVLIREQGEKPIKALADLWLKNQGSLNSIHNIVYKSGSKQLIENPVESASAMVNQYIPDFRDFNLQLYGYPKLPYQLTRGCYWGKCAFCGYRGCKNNYIESSVEKVVRDLSVLKERHGIRIFHFMDDIIEPNYLLHIANRLIKDEVDIIYAAFLRAENEYTFDKCAILQKSGLRTVLFGIESAHPRILKLMKKGLDFESMVSILKNFHKAGIANHLSCIIGFPTETKEEAYATINFLKSNTSIYYKAYLTPFRLFSDMIHEPEIYSIEDIDINNPIRLDKNGYVSFEFKYRVTKGMSIDEFIEVLWEGRQVIGSVPPGPIYYRT